MIIKDISIEGFRSYKDIKQLPKPFDQNLNVIVGHNGAGKSNFFKAILFVITKKFTNLNLDQRQDLLHEGAGRGVMSATVEIVFDNSDKTIDSEDEIHIRRTIGPKKDEYRINGKTVTAKEVILLLDSVGFSSSNPYYVVEQGKVEQLAMLKDEKRFDLLKEVAGTKLYEKKKMESLKIMQRQEAKISTIKESIEFVENTINDLEKEIKEFKDYRELDEARRAIEYTIYNKDLEKALKILENCEASRQKTSSVTAIINAENITLANEKTEQDRTLKRKQRMLTNAKEELEKLQAEQIALKKRMTMVELMLSDDQDQRESAVKKQWMNKLNDVQHQIEKVNEDIKEEQQKHDASFETMNQLNRELDKAKGEKTILYEKAGRAERFQSKAQRDNWLKKQIKDAEEQTRAYTEQIDRSKHHLNQIENRIANREQTYNEGKTAIDQLRNQITNDGKTLQTYLQQRNTLTDKRKQLWRENNEITDKLESTQHRVRQVDKAYQLTAGYSTMRGIKGVQELIRQRNIPGCRGLLIELIKVDEPYHRAVEAIAGKNLFNMVVDNVATAKKIIRLMNSQKINGRVSFIILDVLRHIPEPVNAATDDSITPLWTRIQPLQNDIMPVIYDMFGRSYLARSLKIGSEFARSNNVDCVTLDGDRAYGKGTLQGGYKNPKKLGPLAAFYSLAEAQEEFQALQDEDKSKKTEIQSISQQLTPLIEQITNLEKKLTEAERQKLTHIQNQRSMQTVEQRQNMSRSKLKESIEKLSAALERTNAFKVSYERDLSSGSTSGGLSSQEDAQLNNIIQFISDKEKEYISAERAVIKSQGIIDSLNHRLTQNLHPIMESLSTKLDSLDSTMVEHIQSIDRKAELDGLSNDLDDSMSRSEATEYSISSLQEDIKFAKQSIEEKDEEINNKTRHLQEEGKSMEDILNQQRMARDKKNESIRRIRELGIPKTHAEYEDLTANTLKQKLHSINGRLSKFTHVNKNVLQQYDTYSTKLTELRRDKKERDESAAAIADMIETLDQKKQEMIHVTFDKVNEAFGDIFGRLAEDGTSRLIKRRIEEDSMNDGDDEETFTGVGIAVQFAGSTEEQDMRQLSGGQKTLVALALIFAIQQIDPAPFYIMDEIDSALDPQYRKAVADFIHHQCAVGGQQYIMTTFRDELLEVSPYILGISHENHVSRLDTITKERAMEILQHNLEGDTT